MILCLESSLLGGYLSNEVPGLVTGMLHLAGVNQPMRVELVGNFMRDIAGCRVDFHNPLPNGNLDDVAWLTQTQSGFTGVMTASNRVAKLPRRKRPLNQLIVDPEGLKNLLFFEWFNQQGQRILIQSWHLHRDHLDHFDQPHHVLCHEAEDCQWTTHRSPAKSW